MADMIAFAGKRGDSVKSDCWVQLEIKKSGGITIDLKSKIDVLYGEQTRALINEGLAHFNIENCDVTIEDNGALPFVIMARLEAAVRRLNPDTKVNPWLPEAFSEFSGSDKKQPRRSRLYLPGNEPKFMINAGLHNADGLILDLEDSVAPSEKDAARIVVRNALLHLDFQNCEKMVRINQGEMGLGDLEFIVPYGVQLILVPKVENAEDLVKIAEKVAEISKANGIKHPIWLMPIIESAKGAWFAYDIASAHETVSSLAIGLEDYTADIGTQRTLEGSESFWARAQVINGAKAAGVQAIDTVFSDVADMEGLATSVNEAKSLGFEGKGCIHPRQIDVVHKGFAPDEKEVVRAKKIVLAFEEAERKGLGVVSLGSKMIDPPVVKRALRVVDLALMDGSISQNWREETE